MAKLLPCVEIEPKTPATHAVICLHGLGADGHDLAPLAPYVQFGPKVSARWVLPHARSRPVTLNMGQVMPAWYDLAELNLKRGQDEQGIQRSAEEVRALIERERERGIKAEHILLMGFSQGGAMALYVGLRWTEQLMGIAALSSYLVLEDSLEREAQLPVHRAPIFLGHGTYDPMVPIDASRRADARLRALGYVSTLKTYPAQHEITPEELRDLSLWVQSLSAS